MCPGAESDSAALSGLRIAFDGRALHGPAAGVRRYVWELYSAIAALDLDIECTAVGVPDPMPRPAGIRAIPTKWQPRSNLMWSAVAAPVTLRGVRYDVFHAPAYTAPIVGVRPVVLTIHDVSYAAERRWYPYRSDPIRRAFYRRSAETAAAVVTDASFTRDEIVRVYDVPPDRIHVVPLGVGAPFLAAERPIAAHPPFILTVGDIHPRRNLERLLLAVAEVRRSVPALAGLTLRVVGADRGGLGALRAVATTAGMTHALEILGRVPDDTLIALYRAASALAYPSLYEGFGLPLLEAMACGTPVVAACSSAIPETVGTAALLVDPYDEGAWAAALRHVLQNPAVADRLRTDGWRRARERTWRRTAIETLHVMRAAARGARP